VAHLEAGVLHRGDDRSHLVQLAIGEHVALGELPAQPPAVEAAVGLPGTATACRAAATATARTRAERTTTGFEVKAVSW